MNATMQRISLADVARLAGVQRPVASVWRSRSEGSAAPFPAAVGRSNGRDLFDASQVVAWLQATGRGNNPDVADDVAAFTFAATFDAAGLETVHGCTALLVLREALGRPLASMSGTELVDAADELDLDDDYLFAEIHELDRAGTLDDAARYTDGLAHSAYSTRAAFETLVREKRRLGLREEVETALVPSAVQLVAAAAIEISSTLSGSPAYADAAGGAGEILLAITQRLGEAAPPTVLSPATDDRAERLARRRLRLNGALSRTFTDWSQETEGAAVLVAQYPSESSPDLTPEQILTSISALTDSMPDGHRAVIVAPASVLTDPLMSRNEDLLRTEILRSGRLRAAVTLPRGLVRNKPRQAQALWVLGSGHREVPIAERWTMVADLADHVLDDASNQDLVSDLAASMGNRRDIVAHAFRFARLVPMRSLLAARGSLTQPAVKARPAREDASTDALVRIDALRDELTEHRQTALAFEAAPATGRQYRDRILIQDALAAKNLRYFAGNRIDSDRIIGGTYGIRVIGTPELLEEEARTRRIGQLELASAYSSARRTEPGDVVFCTSPRPAAMVDEEGGAVVVFPARALRVDDGDPGGLVPELVAHALRSGTGTDWRRRAVRRVSDGQREHVRTVLGRLEQEKRLVRDRLTRLEELSALVLETDGIEFLDTEANGR